MCRLLAVSALPFAALLLFGNPATPAAAQEPGSIVGALIDQQTLRPLARGVITHVETGVEVRSGADGAFALPDLDAGDVTIRVQADGYSGTTEPIEVTAGEAVYLQIHLMPLSAMLEEVMVLTGRRTPQAMAGSPPTDVVNREDNGRAQTATDLLVAQVPGLSVHRGGGSVGSGSRVRIRGISSLTQSTAPSIYLDGVRISDPTSMGSRGPQVFAALDEIPANQVKRIRVLRGSSAGAMYGDSANGIILIETHEGLGQ